MKQGRGLWQFLLRGFAKVQGEWKPWSLTHNLRKLHLAWGAWRGEEGGKKRDRGRASPLPEGSASAYEFSQGGVPHIPR